MKLKRELGVFEATFYGVSIILGAGIFALIGKAAGLAGPSLWVSFLISALVAIFTGLSYAELSAMYPKAGAEFVYIKKAYGSNFWAFLIGWLLIFALTSGIATVSLAFSDYLLVFLNLSKIPKVLISIVLISSLSLINFYGIKESSKLNLFFVFMVISSLLFIISLGVWIVPTNFQKYFQAPKGLSGVFSATTLVFFAYLGFENIANISEETKNPRKTVPLALLLSIIITTLVYVLVSLSAVSLASWEELAASPTPLALAASKVLGSKAFVLVSISALFATSGTSLGLLIASSRMMYGMARESSLPKSLSKIHRKRKTPYIAILFTGLLSIAFVSIGSITKTAQVTSLCSLIAFVSINFSLIYLRFMKPEIKRPFKAPINIGKFPLTAFFGAISCLSIMGFFEMEAYISSLIVLLAGMVFFFMFKMGKRR
jgi:APA family basic amino acid/polyamine antiporter